MGDITVREWIKKFNNGDFEKKDFETQCSAGWYDWFCSTEALSGRLKKMGNIIKDIRSDFILNNFRVRFENNCPCNFPLYDDFRFEFIKENEDNGTIRNQFYIKVLCGHPFGSEYMYEVFTSKNAVVFKCKTKKEVLNVIEQLANDFQEESRMSQDFIKKEITKTIGNLI